MESRPQLLFEGGAFALCFGLGVSGYLQDNYDLSASCADVYGAGFGNIPALATLMAQPPRLVLAQLHRYLDHYVTGTPLMGLCGNGSRLREALEHWLPVDIVEIVGDRWSIITIYGRV